VGRVTNALGWVAATPPSWLPEVATADQIDRYVRPAIAGEREECYAITEEGAGSDVDAIEATAHRDGDQYVLNGVKWHVTSYNTADFAFFQARLRGGPHDGEHAMFLVDLPSPGVRVVRTPAYTHTISHHHPIVAFENVRVPAANLVGAEGDGMTFAYEWFRFERLMVAARCLGAAERLTAEMTAFAATRRAGGGVIADHGLVAGMLADSLTELFAARAMAYETARGIDRGLDTPAAAGGQASPGQASPAAAGGQASKVSHAQCSMAKLYCSEMAGRVADRAVQVFGGRGYMRENVAERFYRELRVERIWEGTSEIQRMIIARQMVKRTPAALA
jgi:acyl-CoA dehydrogenase